ncbi:Helicase associated domain protein [Streptomyces lunaelactis]|uniref:DEAD/DEAH box helicase n=2 Tax=Streptomyces lunaelactis TaxID=1535768 RepID=UPI00158507F3|nr:DEAD/DEAH box helicase [Streptomyces lunaelactis]NUK02387.1 Helicase associated domain protein [Streptomyces lunaelactis]NUK16394.1 Helicase associated domain protein [Streptomyces lunaelactis]
MTQHDGADRRKPNPATEETKRVKLRPHQIEAVDAVVRALERPASTRMPAEGLRAQVIMATGSGKTFVAAQGSEKLRAGRVLVLVPSLDLLAQSVKAWREGGRTGPVLGVSSLRGDEVGFASTTDVDELVEWCRGLERVTVFATYASLGLGTLERAHRAGLRGWDLIVVDEAHRTSGRIGKPWAVVHDNQRIPSARRLYMTATPRLWQAGEEKEGQGEAGSRGPGELVASMEDDPNGPFGSVCYRLSLSEAIDRGIVAPYQVVCVDVTDTAFQAAVLLGTDGRSDAVRGARLAALQTALVKAASEEDLKRTLVFHHLTKEAEAFATGLPGITARLWADDPELYPRTIWANWLYGEHKPLHRRDVLAEFASGIAADGTVVEKAFLSSVKVLGEGVDTANCDSVFWADLRGSMPDLVQAVGRALRMQPGEGKVASLVVPVLLAPGETPDTMLTSKSYGALAKLLEALRAHDARVVETLAEPQAPSGYQPVTKTAGEKEGETPEGVSAPARSLLKFSTPRDPAHLAAFIELRVLNPEKEHWRRGMETALAYVRHHRHLKVPFGFKAPEDTHGWPAPLAGFPLGQWIADARRMYGQGRLDEDRVGQLDALGMIWSHFDVAFDEGLAAARGWAAEHGHLLAPVEATWNGAPVGVWLKNQRAAARRAVENEQRRAEGLPVPSSAGELSQERHRALEDIDPSWCPAWPVAWQRRFRLTRQHTEAGGTLPLAPGDVVIQGEDLGQWVQAQRVGWDQLTAAQQWMLEQVLGIEPATEDDKPKPKRSHGDKWAANLAAAKQYFEREGHLHVPRKHIEAVGGIEYKLGAWVANARSRAAKLPPERAEQLSAISMRWA